MKKLKRILTYTEIIFKRLFKNIILIILLCSLPFAALLNNLLSDTNESSIKIGVCYECDDQLADNLRKALDNENAYDFIEYDDLEEMKNQVALGNLECAYRFPKKLSENFKKEKFKNSVDAFISPMSTMYVSIDETIFAGMFRILNYDVMKNIIDAEDSTLAGNNDALEYLYQKYDEYCESDDVFHIVVETISGSRLTDEGTSNTVVTFPMRGMLSILIALSAMMGTIMWINDKNNRIFSSHSNGFLWASRILYILLPALAFVVVSEATLMLSGTSYGIAKELLLSLRYILILIVFCNICISLFKKSEIIMAFIPIIVLGSLIFCPIFINLSAIIPAVDVLSKILLPTYFL